MNEIPPTLSYSSPVSGTCPLCHTRPLGKYRIYGAPVCKKCYYAFANRRQLAYLIDALIWIVPMATFGFVLARWLAQAGFTGWGLQGVVFAVNVPLACLFCMKDGFNGQSPGKKLTDVQALDQESGQPIQFAQSFKRNAILLVGQIPLLGGLAGLIVILIIAVQVAKGFRLGDRFAQTRVIWKKYALSPVFGGEGLICEHCSYDLQGNASGICPECGTVVSQQNATQLAALKMT